MWENDETYTSIDKNEIKDRNALSDSLGKRLRYYSETGDTEKADKCKWDLMIVDLVIDEEKKPRSFRGKPFAPRYVGPDGHIYPDPDGIPEEALDYYEQRLKETRCSLLLALYNDYLWYRRGDHNKARAAVEYYLDLGNSLHAKAEYLDSFEYLFKPVSISLSLRDDPLFEKCIDNLFKTISEVIDRRDFRWVIEPAGIIMDYFGRLKQDNKELFIKQLEIAAEGYKTDDLGNPHIYRSILDIIEKGYRKINNDEKTKATGALIAGSFEDEAITKTNTYEENYFVGSIFLTYALRKYKECGASKVKTDELLKIIKELNEKNLQETESTPFDTGITEEDYNKMVEPHKHETLASNIEFLMYDPRILPSWEAELKEAKEKSEKYIFSRLAPQIIYDGEGNEVGRAYSDEDKNEYNAIRLGILLRYQLNYPYLKMLIEVLKEQGLTAADIIGVIVNAPIIDPKRLSILSAGLDRFFSGDHISFIHIAAFQIEGILRDVLRKFGFPTTKIVRDRGIQEKTLNDILEEPAIREALGDRVYPLIRYVLADRRGYNVRNDVAHGLFPFEAFNEYTSILLLLIILRFCGFEFKNRTDGADPPA